MISFPGYQIKEKLFESNNSFVFRAQNDGNVINSISINIPTLIYINSTTAIQRPSWTNKR